MKFFVTLGLLSCVAVLSQAAPKCHLSDLWSCVEIAIDWFHSLPKRSIPETEADVQVMCNEISKALHCAYGYRDNCTTPLQKELIGLISEGAVNLEKDFCSPGSDSQTKYLAHSACLNKVSQMDEVKEQLEYIMAVLEHSRTVPSNQWITYGCCGYTKVLNTIVKLGKDNCGQEAVDAAGELIGMAIAQLPEVICSGYDGEGAECKAVLPPDGSKMSGKYQESRICKFLQDLLKNWLE